MKITHLEQIPIKAEVMPLYPTMNSLQEVVDSAESHLPIKNRNALVTLLYCYHNTLIKVLKNESK